MNLFKAGAIFAVVTIVALGQSLPYSLDALRDVIGARSEAQAISLVMERKVAFVATDANLNLLRDAGATEKLIEAIVRVAPKPPTGTLSLRCAPGDCMVRIDQLPAEPSQGGQLKKDGLPVGEAVVVVTKDGYAPQQLRATIARDLPAEVSVTLLATEETKIANGKALLDLSLKALGLGEAVTKLNSFNAKGSFASYAPKQRDFQIELQARGRQTLEMKVSNTKGESLLLICDGEACAAPGGGILGAMKLGGKKLPKDVQEEIDPNVRRFPRYNLAALLRVLESPGVRLSAASAEPAVPNTKEQHLLADLVDGSYDYTLGSDLMPTTVTYASKTGLGAAVTITFAAYVDIGNGGRYPKRTTVKAGDVGIQVNFDSVQVVVKP